MSFPTDIQPNIMDCGATCLRIIGRYYGKIFPFQFLRNVTHTGREGTSLLGLSKGAETVGFRALPVTADFNKLRKDAPLPLIAHWNQNHFVVVYKITRSKVFVSDPGSGALRYSHSDFINGWLGFQNRKLNGEGAAQKGVALLLEPTPTFQEFVAPEESERLNVGRFLHHYVKPHTKLIFQIIVSLVFGSILQLVIPFLTQNIVDTGIATKDIGFIWLVLAAQLLLTLGQMTLELARSWILLHVSSRMNISLLSDFFIKLMSLPIRFFDVRLSGDLMQRIQDHHRIEGFLTNTTLNAIFSLFTLGLYGLVLAYYDGILFSVFFSGSALYVVWILFFLKKRAKLDYKKFHQGGATNSKVIELMNGMQEIKLHNAEQQKRWEWERIQVKLFRINLMSLSLEQVQSAGSKIINEVKNIVITVIAAKLVIEGQITLGMMLAISYIVGQLNSPVLQLVAVIKSWQDARLSIERLADIYQKNGENSAGYSTRAEANEFPPQHSLQLNNVSFRYTDISENVLSNIELCIPHGKVTAIVGSSGSGKTTLMKLLMRFYDPSEGQISINNTSINTIDISVWRHHCGVVMQEGYIFNDTIAGNIAVGIEEPNREMLIEAAKTANIYPFIQSLPLGFNTKIGLEGLGISTGQKQRLLIARAVYKNPDILFFDEATSALDANNERTIMSNLEQFYKGKTVVIIAHRLSTVKNADNIIVLESGKIIEQGHHSHLTNQKGNYYNLIKNQLELGN